MWVSLLITDVQSVPICVPSLLPLSSLFLDLIGAIFYSYMFYYYNLFISNFLFFFLIFIYFIYVLFLIIIIIII